MKDKRGNAMPFVLTKSEYDDCLVSFEKLGQGKLLQNAYVTRKSKVTYNLRTNISGEEDVIIEIVS